jgi:hypothetical protein
VNARKRHEKGDDETVDDSSASFNRRTVRGKQGGDVQTPKPLKDRGESAPEMVGRAARENGDNVR